MSLSFEWDAKKEQANIQKHGIDFETAKHVFHDPNMLDLYDEAHSTINEDRFIAIGRAGNSIQVLTVVYTERKSIRIISARNATKREEEYYYDSF